MKTPKSEIEKDRMEMKIEQQRKEIMLCMAAQDFLDLEYYEKEMEKLRLMHPPIIYYLLEEVIYKIIAEYIDEVIKDLKEYEE